MLNIEREIARHIVLSQISSDAGKGIKELHINGDKKAYKLLKEIIKRENFIS